VRFWLRGDKDPDIRVMRDRCEAIVQARSVVAVTDVVVEDPEVSQRRLYVAALCLLQEHAQLVHVLGDLTVMQSLSCGRGDLELADHSKIRQGRHPSPVTITVSIRWTMDVVGCATDL
jgi:hypothetical protein